MWPVPHFRENQEIFLLPLSSNLKKIILVSILSLSIVSGFIFSFYDHIKIKYLSTYGNIKYNVLNINFYICLIFSKKQTDAN